MIISVENLSSDLTAYYKFVPRFQNTVKEYKLTQYQVFNIDESDLNYNMLPAKTLATRNETVEGNLLKKEWQSLCAVILMAHTNW